MGRIERVDSELQRQLSQIINYECADPRIDGMITVHRVETTADLKHAKVFISAFGTTDRVKLLEGLKSSAGFIKGTLFGRLKIRAVPDMVFIYDDGMDHAQKIDQLLREIHRSEPTGRGDAPSPAKKDK